MTTGCLSQLVLSHRASQWHRNKGQNALGWREFRLLHDDWVYFRPGDEDLALLTTSPETFHQTIPWSTVPDSGLRLETFMTPDLEGRPPPHERTSVELRAFYPEPGVLERLFVLKERVDPHYLFDGAGTIPKR